MQNPKVFFVTGATGHQGGAVISNLIDKGFRVKAITRNPSSAAAQNLKGKNTEIIKADLNYPETYKDHLKDVDGVFCALTFENGIQKEIRQGIALADLAKENNIRHFVYSSGLGVELNTDIPHWKSKFEIENYIRKINLPSTIIRPASFYENYLIPQVKSRLAKGKLVSPVSKDKLQQFISTRDIGKIGATILINPDKYLNKTIPIAAATMGGEEAAAIFSETWNKKITYQKLPSFITRLVMGNDLYKMFRWINNHDDIVIQDLSTTKNEFPGLLDLKQWIQLYFKTSS